MNVLIINLTRFGDLLQMQPLILGLKAQGHRVGLICVKNFAPATGLMRGVDYVAPLCGATLLHALDNSWHKALDQVEALVRDMQKNFPVDLVINTTATLSARLLARRIVQTGHGASTASALAPANNIPIWGFGLDENGFGTSSDMWTSFLFAASSERLNCPFNLVDMFRSVARVADIPPLRGLEKPNQDTQRNVRTLLQNTLPTGCKGFVAFQLGASEKRRQWALEHFVQLGAKLWQEKALCPVLLGSAGEKSLGEAYANHAQNNATTQHPHINVMGQTDIPHLAAVLLECKALVTNDTGTMHLAAGLDVPVLGIFLATAQAWDTGPYMQNACCLEPAMPCHPCAFHTPCVHMADKAAQPCLSSIAPSTVYQLLAHFLEQGTWPQLIQNQARVWQTQEDSTGFATLTCLSGHENQERSHWLALQRHFYRHILDDKAEIPPPPPEYAQGLSHELCARVGQTLQQGSQILLLLYEHIILMQRMPSKQAGERILHSCNTLYTLLHNCPQLKALSYLWLMLYQEHGAQWQSFAKLVHLLRTSLLAWHKALTERR